MRLFFQLFFAECYFTHGRFYCRMVMAYYTIYTHIVQRPLPTYKHIKQFKWALTTSKSNCNAARITRRKKLKIKTKKKKISSLVLQNALVKMNLRPQRKGNLNYIHFTPLLSYSIRSIHLNIRWKAMKALWRS